MLQKRKDQGSEQEGQSLDDLRNKLAQEKENIIDTNLEDRQVELIVEIEEAQACGCGGTEKNRIRVIRTVPGDSPLKDGDVVNAYDESDEVQGYA